eukprot:7376284-Prymnesium_polylepis.1
MAQRGEEVTVGAPRNSPFARGAALRATADDRTRRRWRCVVRAADMRVSLRHDRRAVHGGVDAPVVATLFAAGHAAPGAAEAEAPDGLWVEVARLQPLCKRVRVAVGALALVDGDAWCGDGAGGAASPGGDG